MPFNLAASFLLTLTVMKPWNCSFIHPLADSPVTELLLCTYYAPNTAKALVEEDWGK